MKKFLFRFRLFERCHQNDTVAGANKWAKMHFLKRKKHIIFSFSMRESFLTSHKSLAPHRARNGATKYHNPSKHVWQIYIFIYLFLSADALATIIGNQGGILFWENNKPKNEICISRKCCFHSEYSNCLLSVFLWYSKGIVFFYFIKYFTPSVDILWILKWCSCFYIAHI